MKHIAKSLTESEIDMNQNILFIDMNVHKEKKVPKGAVQKVPCLRLVDVFTIT